MSRFQEVARALTLWVLAQLWITQLVAPEIPVNQIAQRRSLGPFLG